MNIIFTCLSLSLKKRRSRHPNIVPFLAAVVEPPQLCIVTELCGNGSLYELLHQKRVVLPLERILHLARGVAAGMSYLHANRIVHRDLKSLNVLIDVYDNAKIADFGLTKCRTATSSMMNMVAGTPLWMAPEVMTRKPYDEKADVYSFGLILWETATNKLPFEGLDHMGLLMAVGMQGERPPLPEVGPRCPQELISLIQDCWHADPSKRPAFKEVLARLTSLQEVHAPGKKGGAGALPPDSTTASKSKSLGDSECQVCFDHPRAILFEPCAHIVCCQACSGLVDSCPICRQAISARKRVYL